MCFLLQHTANGHFCHVLGVCRVFFVLTHGKKNICPVPNVCRVLFLLAHGKEKVCRVPEFWYTVKFFAHGILEVSSSGLVLIVLYERYETVKSAATVALAVMTRRRSTSLV